MNKCYAAALPGLLGLSESAVLDQRFIQTELRMIKTIELLYIPITINGSGQNQDLTQI